MLTGVLAGSKHVKNSAENGLQYTMLLNEETTLCKGGRRGEEGGGRGGDGGGRGERGRGRGEGGEKRRGWREGKEDQDLNREIYTLIYTCTVGISAIWFEPRK